MAQRTTRVRRPGVRALFPRHPGADATFGTRLVLAAIATAVVAVPFALAVVLVESRWPPLYRLDRTTAERLHQTALEHPGWVGFLEFLTSYVWDPVVMRLLVAVVVVWLLTRRAWRLAAWASVTAVAGGLIGILTKHVVERARPHLPDPVSHAPGFSFPSGHAMTATTSCAVLLLVLLPLVPRAWRWLPWALAVTAVVGVGYTRVALGVHWVSDVVGGWLLGITIVTATTLVFEAWRLDTGRRRTTPAQGLEPEISSSAPEPPLALGHAPVAPDEPRDPPGTHRSG
ncbi:phosphatase PAP2 family protein [Streptomyces sp. TX20-6-3]|uniref:phosphatase PAP2 family protein n=1 Tax=Streptomyces sp. TX20-6-3 TaxID=3028705 RepID=UPI0029A4971A|nr:phosphatase PAP2 family protein [Streptomyces sp. TX20-6-3]MDX2561364.1 phosphatase PAP2 family protein [Streptomyces sp. TX20-6-3]